MSSKGRLSSPARAQPAGPAAESHPLFFRAQAAIETLMMMGIVLAFIVPLVFVLYSSTGDRTQALNQVQAQALAQAMSDTAGEVWYAGNGTRRMVLVSFPAGLLNISLGGDLVPKSSLPMRGHEISVVLDNPPAGVDETMIVCPGPVRSEPDFASDGLTPLSPSDKKKAMLVQRISGPGSHLRSGLVALIFENKGNYVNIIRQVQGVS